MIYLSTEILTCFIKLFFDSGTPPQDLPLESVYMRSVCDKHEGNLLAGELDP